MTDHGWVGWYLCPASYQDTNIPTHTTHTDSHTELLVITTANDIVQAPARYKEGTRPVLVWTSGLLELVRVAQILRTTNKPGYVF